MAVKALKDVMAKRDSLCVGSLAQPWGSWFWEFNEAQELKCPSTIRIVLFPGTVIVAFVANE